jgi:hypothetical protein
LRVPFFHNAGNSDFSASRQCPELWLIAIFRAHGITGWRRGAKLGFPVECPRSKAQGRKPRFISRRDILVGGHDGSLDFAQASGWLLPA